jgi:hypothetical protein
MSKWAPASFNLTAPKFVDHELSLRVVRHWSARRIAERDALVACTLVAGGDYALRNIDRLPVQIHFNRRLLPVKAPLLIPDDLHGEPGGMGNVVAGDLRRMGSLPNRGRPKRLRLKEVTPAAAPLRSRRRETPGSRSAGSHRTRTFVGRRRGRHRPGSLHRTNALDLLGIQWPPSRPKPGADRIGRQQHPQS